MSNSIRGVYDGSRSGGRRANPLSPAMEESFALRLHGDRLTRLDDSKKTLMNAFEAFTTHARELNISLEKLPIPAGAHDYANLMCLRVAETKALKNYLHLQNEFFEKLKAETPPSAVEPIQPLMGESGWEQAGGRPSDT
jgi:hypothetical protein